MGRILYKDIELDEANKEVHFAHSRFGGRSSDETSRCDLAFEARDMRDGKDAFASTEQENVQGLRDCNR